MMTKFWCPGCDDLHMVSDDWQVTGVGPTLTIQPSVLVYERQKLINEDLDFPALTAPENVTMAPRCHSFVTNGHIQFLGDSTHQLAGQTVPLPPLPDWCA
ncbi:DUF6527 family protein [Pseudarthrobacter sp. NIBRBAC000502771]|uniref:DUF6527 family protein n=1 Tax=Pseudarthrobacter sp. NIBRBAC000502771 TaxID=2590774 RepID=UPI001131E8ED|nr:DUF6527 family protein [Pseudarthrobacter sp. NIBRBAC000502771]QDG61233.1 ammonia monooxygenase [Pseudarthrobacter sp. NIBRBAC000502771]